MPKGFNIERREGKLGKEVQEKVVQKCERKALELNGVKT